jgi:hypothetical protein
MPVFLTSGSEVSVRSGERNPSEYTVSRGGTMPITGEHWDIVFDDQSPNHGVLRCNVCGEEVDYNPKDSADRRRADIELKSKPCRPQ